MSVMGTEKVGDGITVAGKESQNGHSSVESTLKDEPKPSDGGWYAWLQVCGAFVLFFNTWGLANSFGVYQTFYHSEILSDRSDSQISWIGSIQGGLLFFGGFIAGPFFDMGYLRTLLIAGTFLEVLGMMMTSICKTYWQVVLSQGVVVGLGFGCLFLPSIAIISQHFTTRKALASGIASVGTSLGCTFPPYLIATNIGEGGIIFPILFRELVPQIGFGWTTRIIAFVSLVTMAIPITTMRQKNPPEMHRRAFFDLGSMKNKPYVIFVLGLLFGFMGIYVTFYYIQLYALERTDITPELASYLLVFINTSSVIGRILPNFVADKIGPLNVQFIFSVDIAVLCLGWIAIRSSGGIIIFAVLYGLVSGSFTSLPGATVIGLSKDLSKIGAQLSMSFLPAGCGLMIGEPIAGAILHGDRYWIGLQLWIAALVTLSGLFTLSARFVHVGMKPTAIA